MLIGEGYIIRSLYFDSLYDRDFYDKEDGVEKRRKIRLRIYDPNQDFAMLEMKQKDGKNQLKRSLRITKKDAEELILGNYSVLLNYKEDFAAECYSIMNMYLYKPKQDESVVSIVPEVTFYGDGIEACKEDMEKILKEYKYDKLGYAYHYYKYLKILHNQHNNEL